MRKLGVFNSITIDGYFTDKNNDMSWAHRANDPEWIEFTEENAKSGGELVFGRVTYDLMKSFWPTEMAAKQFPELAEQMNKLPKVVFSRTLESASWQNTRLIKGDLAKLIDEYQLVVNPIALGAGRTIFDGIKEKLNLKLTNSRAFKNGNVLLTYEPAH